MTASTSIGLRWIRIIRGLHSRAAGARLRPRPARRRRAARTLGSPRETSCPMASQSRVRIDDRVNERAEGLAVLQGPGELTHPDDLAVRREEFHLNAHGPGSDGRASDKGFASRRVDLRENLRPLPSEVCRDPFHVRVEDFGQLLAGRLGSGGPEVPERLDPPTAADIAVTEVQDGLAADLLRRYAATDLHGPPSSQPYLKLIPHDRPRVRHGPHPLISGGNLHGPAPGFEDRGRPPRLARAGCPRDLRPPRFRGTSDR